jgi:hypothetical protein
VVALQRVDADVARAQPLGHRPGATGVAAEHVAVEAEVAVVRDGMASSSSSKGTTTTTGPKISSRTAVIWLVALAMRVGAT